MSKIVEGAREAVAVAKGEEPAAAVWINGHRYVPEAKLREAVEVILGLRACFGHIAGDNTDSAAAYAELEADQRACMFLATMEKQDV